jgi:hypothetical protein
MNYFIFLICAILTPKYIANINSFDYIPSKYFLDGISANVTISTAELKVLDVPTLKERVEQLGKDSDAVIGAVNALKQKIQENSPSVSDDDIDKEIAFLLIDIDNYLVQAENLQKTRAAELKAQRLDEQLADAKVAFEKAKRDIEIIQKKLVVKRKVAPETLQKELNELLAKGKLLLKETVYDERGFTNLISEITIWRGKNVASIEASGLKDFFDEKIADFETAIYNKKNRIVTDVLGSVPFTYNMTFELRQTYKKKIQMVLDYHIRFTFGKKMINNEVFWAVTKAELLAMSTSTVSAKGLGNFVFTKIIKPVYASAMLSSIQLGVNLQRHNESNPLAECNQDMTIFLLVNKQNGKHVVTVEVPDETICNACGYKKSVTYSCFNIAIEKDKAKQTLEDFFNKN